jgi:hypothetical protein
MAAAGELVAGMSGDGQHGADYNDNGAERPDEWQSDDEADDQQDDPEKNHGFLLSGEAVRLGRGKARSHSPLCARSRARLLKA